MLGRLRKKFTSEQEEQLKAQVLSCIKEGTVGGVEFSEEFLDKIGVPPDKDRKGRLVLRTRYVKAKPNRIILTIATNPSTNNEP